MEKKNPRRFEEPTARRSLSDYFFLFLERSWIIAISLLAAGIYGQYKLKSTPDTYRATATIEVLRNLRAAGDISNETFNWRAYTDIAATVSQKLNLDSLFYGATAQPRFADFLPDPNTVSTIEYENARRSLATFMNQITNVTIRPRSPLLNIEAIHTDPSFVKETIEGMLEEYKKLGSDQRAGESDANLEFLTKEIDEIRENLGAAEQSLVIYNDALTLRDEIRVSEAKIREMEKEFLDKWPALVQERALLESLQSAFVSELERITDSSEVEFTFWEQHRDTMGNFAGSQLINFQIQTAEARNNMLERDFQTESDLYDTLLAQMKRGDVESDFEQSEIAILQPPITPEKPIGPIPMKFYIRYGILGLGAGFLIAFFLGMMDTTIRRVEELERVAGVPAFAMVPKSNKLKDTPNLESGSVLSESFRTLHSNIFLKEPEAKTILISSSVPGEGKSTISCNLAATAASWGWGEKVLLVDLDLRRPKIGEILGVNPNQKGSCDCLKGLCSVEEAIISYPEHENFDVMVGGVDRFKNGLPDDRDLAKLIEVLKTKYGRIIIDSAPVLAVNDTIIMAQHVDLVCLAFKMWKTPRKALLRALGQLRENSAEPAGVISNFMPKRKGLGQYGYYYSYSGSGYDSYA